MQSAVKDVAAYIEQAPQDRRQSLVKFRDLCLATLTAYAEGIEYGMPCYKKDGVAEVAFASQKNYISVYIMKEGVVNANRDLLRGSNVGKGCIRYTSHAKLDFRLLRKLLSDTVESQEDAC